MRIWIGLLFALVKKTNSPGFDCSCLATYVGVELQEVGGLITVLLAQEPVTS